MNNNKKRYHKFKKNRHFNHPSTAPHSSNQNAQTNSGNKPSGLQNRFNKFHQFNQIFSNEIKAHLYHIKQIFKYVEPCSEEQLLWSINLQELNIKQLIANLINNEQKFLDLCTHVKETLTLDYFQSNQADIVDLNSASSRSIEYLFREFLSQKNDFENIIVSMSNSDFEKPITQENKTSNLFELLKAHNSDLENALEKIFDNMQRHKPWFNPNALNKESMSAY